MQGQGGVFFFLPRGVLRFLPGLRLSLTLFSYVFYYSIFIPPLAFHVGISNPT